MECAEGDRNMFLQFRVSPILGMDFAGFFVNHFLKNHAIFQG